MSLNGYDPKPEIDAIKQNLAELHRMASEQTDLLAKLADVVEVKMDKLIDVIAGRGMIPVDVFKWLVFFVIVFVFAMQFGVKGAGEIFQHIRGSG